MMSRTKTYIYTLLFFTAAVMLAACNKKNMALNGGIYNGETEDGKPSGYGSWNSTAHKTAYYGFWLNGKKDGNGTLTWDNYCYRGGFKNDKFTGYGILTRNDSTLYEGQWADGKRNGYGVITDSCGRKIEGVWNCDTLTRGTRRDSTGVYHGQMNRYGVAEGHGYFDYSNGTYYEGQWTANKRDLFGFSVVGGTHIKAGEWSHDRFRGERVIYRPNRIYGIDISRYQHGKGKKKYPIDWKHARITHLGSISKKNVMGTVDYPISFAYIKSTEGRTLINRFYVSDYLQARKYGIHCGAYHFFSTVSDPVEQANFFLKHSIIRKGDMPPALDLEPTKEQIKKMGGIYILFYRVKVWLRAIERRTGRRPILYVNQSFVNKYLPLAPELKRDYMVWIARYGEYKPDVKLIYWQLCPDGTVRGIRGEVDINVFNGFRDRFDEFINGE